MDIIIEEKSADEAEQVEQFEQFDYVENADQNAQDSIYNESLEEYLCRHFKSLMITPKEFRDLIKVSKSFMYQMRLRGNMPRMIALTEGGDEVRFLIRDVAQWIERNGCFLNNKSDGSLRRSCEKQTKRQVAAIA